MLPGCRTRQRQCQSRIEGQMAQQGQHALAMLLQGVEPAHHQVEQPLARGAYLFRIGQGERVRLTAEGEQDGTRAGKPPPRARSSGNPASRAAASEETADQPCLAAMANALPVRAVSKSSSVIAGVPCVVVALKWGFGSNPASRGRACGPRG